MKAKKADLLPGTLEVMILGSLARESLHGWGIAKRIEQASSDVLKVNQGSLYPALHRLEDRGWIRATVDLTPEGRPVKIYMVTSAGRQQLKSEAEHWFTLSSAVTRVLEQP